MVYLQILKLHEGILNAEESRCITTQFDRMNAHYPTYMCYKYKIEMKGVQMYEQYVGVS